jgi:predicted nucleic acid-binding Zn ribbon protein
MKSVCMTKCCKHCGSAVPLEHKKSLYCSDECRRAVRLARRGYTGCGYEKECSQCGKQFTARTKVDKWCSNECMNANRRSRYVPKEAKPQKPCEVCGELFTPRNSRSKYCSKKCGRIREKENRDYTKEYRHYNPTQEVECVVCGELMLKTNSQKTCSLKCRKVNNRSNQRKWKKAKLSEDMVFYMVEKVRKRISHNKLRISKGAIPRGAMRHLNYTIQDLLDYWIATDWPDGLPQDWHNGNNWHIDHINSTYDELLSKEDITMEDVIHHNRMENLRLVSALENRQKGRKSGVDWRIAN